MAIPSPIYLGFTIGGNNHPRRRKALGSCNVTTAEYANEQKYEFFQGQ